MHKRFSHILGLYFLAISFLPNSGMAELFKVGNLIKHFTHHQVAHGEDIDFIAFLALHYLNAEHQEKDAHEHTNLPFQKQGNQLLITSVSFVFLPPTSFSWHFQFSETQSSDIKIPSYQEAPLSSFSYSVWQPPKSFC